MLCGLRAMPSPSVQSRAVGAMRFDDWLRTRVIAVAAHGLDVAITLNRQPWTTAAALQVIRPVLVVCLVIG